jgi:hypothetical protein
MHKFLETLVMEDTPEAWDSLRKQMPWNYAGKNDAEIFALGFEDSEIDPNDADAVRQVIEDNPEGKVWMEMYLDGGLEIGDDFVPYIINCQQIVCLTKDSNPSEPSAILISQEAKPKDIDRSAISLLVVACPRCQLMFTQGDEDIEFEPDNDDWIVEDCIACEGNGEWEYEPL